MNFAEYKKENGINCEDPRGEEFFTGGNPSACILVTETAFEAIFRSENGACFGLLKDDDAPHTAWLDDDDLNEMQNA